VANRASPFDPYELLSALKSAHVNFVVIGAFARMIHGTGEITDGLDITPSMRGDNVSRLEKALDDLEAVRVDDRPLDVSGSRDPVIDLRTRAGKLRVVPAAKCVISPRVENVALRCPGRAPPSTSVSAPAAPATNVTTSPAVIDTRASVLTSPERSSLLL
jgi:hypothetical protein